MKRSHSTRFIDIDTQHCEACWDCIDVCPTQVLGKVEVLWHRHVRIDHAEACNGCKKCVRACQHGAITYTYTPVPREQRHRSGDGTTTPRP